MTPQPGTPDTPWPDGDAEEDAGLDPDPADFLAYGTALAGAKAAFDGGAPDD